MSNIGSYNVIKDDYISKLFYNSELIHSSSKSPRYNKGMFAFKKKLINEGSLVANCGINKEGVVSSNNLYFNNVVLSNNGKTEAVNPERLHGIVINNPLEGDRSYNPYSTYLLKESSLEDNEEHRENGDNLGRTYSLKDCPILFIKYFNASVKLNSNLVLDYFVDTKSMDSINRGIFNSTFTIYVYNTEGDIVAKKTTYAGWHKLELPSNITSEYGETYFIVKCVDNRGVGSGEQCFDIYVKEFSSINYYNMTENDLTFTYKGDTYTIYINDPTEINAYKNKLALTALFRHVKEDLLDAKGNHYNGIIMYNEDTSYWLSYFSNLNLERNHYASINDPINLRETAFYEVEVGNSNGTRRITSIKEITEDYALDKFKNTTEKFHGLNSSTLPFTLNDVTSLSLGKHYYVYCRTSNDTSTIKGTGDFLTFPDNFTIDLNGASIRATKNYSRSKSELIRFYENFDTHLINGKIVGDYEDYDMYHAAMLIAPTDREYVPCEWVSTTYFYGSKFCSMENLEVSYCTGYSGCSNATGGTRVGISFGEIGAIDASGNNASCNYMCRTPEASKVQVSGNGFTSEVVIGPNTGVLDYSDNFEIFLACYSINNKHIKTIKTRLFTRTKLPKHTYYVRACSYLISPRINSVSIGSIKYPINVAYKNCYWHDTRTIAVNPCYSDNILFYNNRYKNIAIESVRPVTKVFGDIEDSHWFMSRVIMKNCTNEGGGRGDWVINEVHWFEFTGNRNITLAFTNEGLFGAYIANNEIPLFRINNINKNYKFPSIIFDSNVLNSAALSKAISKENMLSECPILTFTNCKLKTNCNYRYLNLVRTKNGEYLDTIYN